MPRESSAVSLAPRVSLETGLREIGLTLPQDRILGLRRYLEMLSRWNQVYNLTALSDPSTRPFPDAGLHAEHQWSVPGAEAAHRHRGIR